MLPLIVNDENLSPSGVTRDHAHLTGDGVCDLVDTKRRSGYVCPSRPHGVDAFSRWSRGYPEASLSVSLHLWAALCVDCVWSLICSAVSGFFRGVLLRLRVRNPHWTGIWADTHWTVCKQNLRRTCDVRNSPSPLLYERVSSVFTSVDPSLMYRITAPWLVMTRDSSLAREGSGSCPATPRPWRGKLCFTNRSWPSEDTDNAGQLMNRVTGGFQRAHKNSVLRECWKTSNKAVTTDWIIVTAPDATKTKGFQEEKMSARPAATPFPDAARMTMWHSEQLGAFLTYCITAWRPGCSEEHPRPTALRGQHRCTSAEPPAAVRPASTVALRQPLQVQRRVLPRGRYLSELRQTAGGFYSHTNTKPHCAVWTLMEDNHL